MAQDNYKIQAQQAKRHFLTYDHQAITEKLQVPFDDTYIYVNFLCLPYRISKQTGGVEKQIEGSWVEGESFDEVMTLLDLICDSREDRSLSGKWKSMQDFGIRFHQNLLEKKRDPMALRFDGEPELLHRAMERLQGQPVPGCDIGFSVELFDGLRIGLQFWHGDEEFAPRLRYLLDENALQYLRYETMYFAVSLLLRRILECDK